MEKKVEKEEEEKEEKEENEEDGWEIMKEEGRGLVAGNGS